MNNYHKVDSKILEFDLNSIEFKFGMWITKKEFGQRINIKKPLPKGQFYMSVRIVAKDIEVTEKIARRLIKQFTTLEIIKLVKSSKNPKEGSIYEYIVQVESETKKGTVEDIVRAQLGHSKSEETSDFGGGEGHSKGTYEGTVKGTSKNNNKRKENNIYTNLSFIDDSIDKVKITEEQYNKLKNKYDINLLHKEIISLDNYISNGKGSRYKDHYKVLNNWCGKSQEKPKVSSNIAGASAYDEFKFDW